MPSRTDFLSSGLVPVRTANPETECSICTCPFSNPVKLPCAHGHIFCRECIKHWLNMKGMNTCPLDKIELFDLPPSEDTHAPRDRGDPHARALLNNTLKQHSVTDFVPYSSGFSVYALQRSTTHAIRYLVEFYQPRPSPYLRNRDTTRMQHMSGPVIIRISHLSPSLTTIANLIPTAASALSRRYSRQQQQDWNLVMEHLWYVLGGQDGKKYDAVVMPIKLRKAVMNSLKACYSDVENMAFFFQHSDLSVVNPQYDDLEFLLDYLTLCASDTQREEEHKAAMRRETKAKRKEERDEPKMASRCGPM